MTMAQPQLDPGDRALFVAGTAEDAVCDAEGEVRVIRRLGPADGVPIDSPFHVYEVKSEATGAIVQVFADELTPLTPGTSVVTCQRRVDGLP